MRREQVQLQNPNVLEAVEKTAKGDARGGTRRNPLITSRVGQRRGRGRKRKRKEIGEYKDSRNRSRNERKKSTGIAGSGGASLGGTEKEGDRDVRAALRRDNEPMTR